MERSVIKLSWRSCSLSAKLDSRHTLYRLKVLHLCMSTAASAYGESPCAFFQSAIDTRKVYFFH